MIQRIITIILMRSGQRLFWCANCPMHPPMKDFRFAYPLYWIVGHKVMIISQSVGASVRWQIHIFTALTRQGCCFVRALPLAWVITSLQSIATEIVVIHYWGKLRVSDRSTQKIIFIYIEVNEVMSYFINTDLFNRALSYNFYVVYFALRKFKSK